MEAHAAQEWPMGTIRSSIGQHKTIEERKIAANAHRAKNSTLSKFPFVIDTMDNIFYEKFGAWPETHLLIDGNGKLIWPPPGNCLNFFKMLILKKTWSSQGLCWPWTV